MSVDILQHQSARIRSEQIRIAYQQMPGVFLFPSFMGSVLVLLLWDEVSHVRLMTWLVLVTFIYSVAGGILYRSFRRADPDISRIDLWGYRFTAFSAIAGFTWGLAGFILFVPDSFAPQTILGAFMFGGAAAQMTFTAAHKPAFLVSVALSLTPIATRLAMEWDGLHLVSSLACVLYFGMLLHFQKNIHDALIRTMRLQFENEELVRKLRQKNSQIEKADQAKSRFLAAASHDLRQPLHAQSLFMSELDTRITDSESRKILGYLKRAAQGMGQLLNALLDISRLDADAVQPERVSFPVTRLLTILEEEFMSQMQEKGLRFRVIPNNTMVYSDPVLINRILHNLLANALKYTAQGAVVVGCRRRGKFLRIEIRDSGIGIPQDKQLEIFEEFSQLSNPERDREKGLGLGLAIVDRLSRLLDHPLGLKSKPGRGTTTSIDVPVATSAVPSVHEDVFTYPADNSLKSCRILVIDDDVDVRIAMERLLDSWGCITQVVGSLTEALHHLRQDNFKPDVVVADYRLREGMNGVVAINTIRELMSHLVPGILVTGDTSPDRIREARESGLPMLYKPVQAEQLYSVLASLER